MHLWVFVDGVPSCRIVVADQAAGVIASMPVSMPEAKLQHCSWHVAQNMKKRLSFGIENRLRLVEAELKENRKLLLVEIKAGE